MQYKVPQGVDMQDRVLGPFTLIQFGFLLFGGLASYFLYLKLPKPIGFWVAIGFFSLSLLISFDSVRRIIMAAFVFISKPRARVWHKVNEGFDSPTTPITTAAPKQNKVSSKKKSRQYKDISELANILDTHGHKENEYKNSKL